MILKTMNKINPYMITLARESREMVLADLGDRLNITAQGVKYLEGNFNNDNPASLKQLSIALGYPESFFLQNGNSLALPFLYRKGDQVTAKQMDALDANVNIYRMNIEKLVTAARIKVKPLPILDVRKLGSPQNCAKELRKLWGVNPGPIKNLSELLEKHKIMLLSYDFGTDFLDGKCTIAADQVPIIVTNSRLLGDRQRFTLAYNLGYLIMHWKTLPDFDRDLAKEAMAFAGEFLMPAEDLRPDVTNLKFSKLPELKTKWKVSMSSLVVNAFLMEAITYNQKTTIKKEFSKRNIKLREPREYDIPVEKYNLVSQFIIKYQTKEELMLKQMADFFCLHQQEFLARYEINK